MPAKRITQQKKKIKKTLKMVLTDPAVERGEDTGMEH
jgi:hypothetical protein